MGQNKVFSVANCEIEIHNTFFLDSCWDRYKKYNAKKQGAFSVYASDNYDVFYGTLVVALKDTNYKLLINHSGIFSVNQEWTQGKLLLTGKEKGADNFLLKMFCVYGTQNKGLIFHSSLIEYQGNGIMFLGPSGIGKTTQAELWNKCFNALIINGDIAFVQETQESFLGWGTPWHGSSPYCENTSVPVQAMIILKQASKNAIRELKGFEKVSAVSDSVFYPKWLENGMELCLETLDHLLRKVPVYELSCRPDEEAVRITEEAIFNGKPSV